MAHVMVMKYNGANVPILGDQACDKLDLEIKRSGKLLLVYCVDAYQKHYTGWEWNDNIFHAMKVSKNNIITKKDNYNVSSR